MGSPCAVYDFRMNADGLVETDLIRGLRQLAKHFIFQEEKAPTTGYLHYQGRLSLIKKSRKHDALKLFEKLGLPAPNYFEPTVGAPKTFDYNSYGAKVDSRTRGPWSDKEEEIYIPRQYRGLMDKLYPYQQEIFDTCKNFDTRYINLIYCANGNKGKSSIAHLCRLHLNGIVLPPLNDHKELIQACCDVCMAKEIRDTVPIFIDLPRAMNKERLNGIYTAIEVIKQGYLCDTRYKFRQWDMDSPVIWVFTNIEPDLSMLSKDRWKVYVINDDYRFERYEVKDIDLIDPDS